MSCQQGPGATHWSGCACHEADWARRLAEAEARAERYREALLPFAAVAPLLGERDSDAAMVVGWAGMRGTGRLNHGDFRRAAALLTPPPADGKGVEK